MPWRNAMEESHEGMQWRNAMKECHEVIPWRNAMKECHDIIPWRNAMKKCHEGIPWRNAMEECHAGMPVEECHEGIQWRNAIKERTRDMPNPRAKCRCFCVMLAIIHAFDAGLDFNDLENEDTTIVKMFPSAKHDDTRDQSGAQRGLQNPRTKKSDQSKKNSKINKDL